MGIDFHCQFKITLENAAVVLFLCFIERGKFIQKKTTV